MRYEITPVPKPRQTRRDKWGKRPCVVRYREFADELRRQGASIAPGARIEFHLPMPPSWSNTKKKEMNGLPHTQKPDIDNLIKSALDAVHKDDSKIWRLGTCEKRWAYKGYIMIFNEDEK